MCDNIISCIRRMRYEFAQVSMVLAHLYQVNTLDVNSSLPRQNGRHFADDIFRCSFVNEKFHILIKISLKFVPKCPIDNNPAFV